VLNNLLLLPSGPLPPNPAELLGSKRMQELLEVLKDKADMVVIDSPPITVISDAVALASRMDGVLVVFRAGRTRWDNARNALNALAQVKARVLGAVLNGTGAGTQDYYYRYRTDYGVRSRNAQAKLQEPGPQTGPVAPPARPPSSAD
jgi:capsular exopolysaccharide synthesis family protein